MRRPLAAAGAALLVLSLSLLFVAAMRGEASLVLLFIIPVLTITGPLGVIGALLLPAALLLLFLSLLPAGPGTHMDDGVGQTETRWGGVIMLGPIPIPFSAAKGQWWLIPLAILMTVLLLLILLL